MDYTEKDKTDEKDRKRVALFGTGIFHGLLLLLFLMVSWTEPDPLPEPDPIEFVEFDFSGGSGSAGGSSAAANPTVTENSSAVVPENLATEAESEVVVPPKNNVVKTKPTVTNSEPKPNPNALFGGNSNGNSTSGNSVGNNVGDGNGQSGNSTGTSNGNGTGPVKGNGASISGRIQTGFPKPANPNFESGKLFFFIWVNKAGYVTRLQLDQARSTANDAALIEACKAELLNKKIVNEDPTADAEQKGVYVFEFVKS